MLGEQWVGSNGEQWCSSNGSTIGEGVKVASSGWTTIMGEHQWGSRQEQRHRDSGGGAVAGEQVDLAGSRRREEAERGRDRERTEVDKKQT